MIFFVFFSQYCQKCICKKGYLTEKNIHNMVIYVPFTIYLIEHIFNCCEKQSFWSGFSRISSNRGTYVRWWFRNRCAHVTWFWLFHLFKGVCLDREQSRIQHFFPCKTFSRQTCAPCSEQPFNLGTMAVTFCAPTARFTVLQGGFRTRVGKSQKKYFF